jgi:opacity protein-like surface antigen
LGGGIGVAEVFGEVEGFPSSTNPNNGTGHDTVVTFYVKAGLTYPITPHADLGLQYRFYGSPGFSFKGAETDEYYAHAASVIFRWKF